MCLLHTHHADTAFDEADIHDFYTYNSDGIGVMWADDGILYTHKSLPKSKAAAWEFYQAHIQGKECVVHWRMKTHGHIDLINCHPYSVFGDGSLMPMSIMHNGILSTGNSKDVSKSDTWHYVEDILKPLLQDHPEMFNNPVIKMLIEDHIGHGNRFIMLNHLGEMVIFHEKDFVDYKGAKLSNTYAWSSEKGGFHTYSTSNFRGSSYVYGADDTYDPQGWQNYRSGINTSTSPSTYSGTHTSTLEATYRKKASEFFATIGELGYTEAFQDLTYSEVMDAIEDTGAAIWDDFMEAVVANMKEDDILLAVRDVDVYMLNLLYEMDYVEETEIEQTSEGVLLEIATGARAADEEHLKVGLM